MKAQSQDGRSRGWTPDWKGKVGFVPLIVEQIAPKPENTIAIVCGPPIMIKLTMPMRERLQRFLNTAQ